MQSEHQLSLFQKVLLATDGTVTDLIALYYEEPIRVIKLEQSVRLEASPAELACDKATRILRRTILLSGAVKIYMHAESGFVFDRMSPWLQEQMLSTDLPVGLLWKQSRLETFREMLGSSVGPREAIAPLFGLSESEPFVSRSYRIHHAGKPLGMISETWPLSYFR